MTNRRLTTIALAAALAATLAGCGGSGENEERAALTTTAASEPTTTEEEEVTPPVTEAERAWLAAVKRYQARLQRETHRNITITQASMQRRAKLYDGCARMLGKAGDPGRFQPAATLAGRACKRLGRAADALGKAMGASDASGAVLSGSPEQKIFERSLDAAFEAAGNADYDLQLAEERATSIERKIDRAQ